MTVAAPARLTPPALSADRLLDTPLPQLLKEHGVTLDASTITDPTFVGAFIERHDGSRVLSMPTGRTWLEHDTVARYLLAQALDVDLPKLPAPFVTSEI
ncbi:MAG: hypothetical protein LBV60_05570 [Streptomyces sp.]|nr:hypothetical protein [Streptomyces sp.]